LGFMLLRPGIVLQSSKSFSAGISSKDARMVHKYNAVPDLVSLRYMIFILRRTKG